MTYQGVVRNGKVDLEDGASLPEGTVVRIQTVDETPDPVDTLYDEAVETGIPDLASQHDHYAHGTPKRET
ncbi:MAG: hypothetical protein GY778_03335 [bacterium]|nr:hypothetical protein [bacterium]